MLEKIKSHRIFSVCLVLSVVVLMGLMGLMGFMGLIIGLSSSGG
jgi:hypothetical protein